MSAIPCSAFVLLHFPKPSIPRKNHQCRICGQIIKAKEPCCMWSGLTDGEGYRTYHAHPECYNITQGWDWMEWETTSPGDGERPTQQMQWPQ